MNDIKSKEYILLTNIEQKTNALASCSCLLSLNAISLSVAVDACRVTKYLELLLAQWRQCLPLGDAKDVNFPLWGNKIWEMIQRVRYAYSLNKVEVNSYQFESECFLAFKERQAEVDALEASMEPFRALSGADVPTVAVCALRELNEVLMQITEFLNSPTEELISSSFEQWEACYQHHYSAACHSAYHKWKIQYSPRTLRKNLQERMRQELEQFKQMFLNDGEFELVFDVEQQRIDSDGLSRFLFTHADRFGVSFIDARPMFSANLIQLFNFVELWRLMQADQQPARKRAEKAAEQEDELEKKVLEQVSKVQHLATEQWAGRLPQVWKSLLKAFRSEIAKAGAHEKFKEYSKKTVYCILGHLKLKGMYQSEVTNVDYTRLLEGTNSGMRKYVNNGLIELEAKLKQRIAEHVEKELLTLVA
jgi:hypothetical protein